MEPGSPNKRSGLCSSPYKRVDVNQGKMEEGKRQRHILLSEKSWVKYGLGSTENYLHLCSLKIKSCVSTPSIPYTACAEFGVASLGSSFHGLPGRGRHKPASPECGLAVEAVRPRPGGGAGALT